MFLLHEKKKIICLQLDLDVVEVLTLNRKVNIEVEVFDEEILGKEFYFVDFFLFLIIVFDIHGKFAEAYTFIDEIV